MDSGNTVLRLINAKIKYNGGEKVNKIFKTNTGLLPSQKVYSLDTCMFIFNEINIKYRNTEQYSKHFIAISPDNDLMIFHGIVHFCKIYNFSPGSVKLRLDKKLFKPYHGWNFFSINN